MSVHKRSLKNRLSYILLTFIVVLALLTTVFFAQLSRHISEISEFESKQAALDVINAAINRELEKLPQSSYIKISETDGRINLHKQRHERCEQASKQCFKGCERKPFTA